MFRLLTFICKVSTFPGNDCESFDGKLPPVDGSNLLNKGDIVGLCDGTIVRCTSAFVKEPKFYFGSISRGENLMFTGKSVKSHSVEINRQKIRLLDTTLAFSYTKTGIIEYYIPSSGECWLEAGQEIIFDGIAYELAESVRVMVLKRLTGSPLAISTEGKITNYIELAVKTTQTTLVKKGEKTIEIQNKNYCCFRRHLFQGRCLFEGRECQRRQFVDDWKQQCQI